MTPLWITFILGFGVLFSFQNCQNPPHADEFSVLSQNGKLVQSSGKTVLAEQKLVELQLISKIQEQISKNGNVFSLISERKYQFSFDVSGVRKPFTVSSDAEPQAGNFCLTDQLQSELQGILAAASICQKREQAADSTVLCAAVIVPAYAHLQTETESFNLGAATDACLSNSVDFCDDEGTLLKGFTKHLDTQLNTLTCN